MQMHFADVKVIRERETYNSSMYLSDLAVT